MLKRRRSPIPDSGIIWAIGGEHELATLEIGFDV
jgi:hypothetical protein